MSKYCCIDDKRKEYLEWMKEENPSFRQIEERIKAEKENKPIKSRPQSEVSIRGDNMNINLNLLGFNSIYYKKLEKPKREEFIEKLKKVFEEYLKSED